MRVRNEWVAADESLADNVFFSLKREADERDAGPAMLRLTPAGGEPRGGVESTSAAALGLCRVVAIDASSPELLLEDFQGLPLKEALRRGTLRSAVALKILRGLAEALDEMHRRGMVHGTFGQWSVLVSEDHRVRVVDWAVTFPHMSAEQCRALLDSAAPELLLAEPVVAATDQFALGILALRLLTGEQAFALGTAQESLLGRLTGIWKGEGFTETTAATAFDRVFAADPPRRFASCGQFVESLERQLAAAASEAERSLSSITTAAPPAEPPRRLSRWPIYATRVASACAVAAFALGVLTWRSEGALATLEAKGAAGAGSSSKMLLVNGHMKVCNSSERAVTIRQLAVGYWSPEGHLETFATSRAERQSWGVAPNSEQTLSWTPASASTHSVAQGIHQAELWDGSVLFYFLDIEQDGKQYILTGTWSDADHGCLAIVPKASRQG